MTWASPCLLLLACAPPAGGEGAAPRPGAEGPGSASLQGGPQLDRPVAVVGDRVIDGEADLVALAGVEVVLGDVIVQGTDLEVLSLPDLRHVTGELRIWENAALVALDLPALERVDGDLSLYDDPALTSLASLERLRTVGGQLTLNRLPSVVDTDPLVSLETVGGTLYVFHMTGLTALELPALEEVGAEVDLWETYALTRVSLPSLHTIGTALDLFEADALTTLSLPALTGLGTYELHHCDAMTDLGDFPQLASLNRLIVKYDVGLLGLEGLPALERIDGDVLIRHDRELLDLGGLDALVEIGGELEVDGNAALVSLGLPALEQMGELVVKGNGALVDPGLASLATLDGDASVFDNRRLSQCALDALFDRIDVGGAVSCGDNHDDGCVGWCEGGAP